MRAAVGWWRRYGWLTVDPTDALERRRERVDRTRALTRGQLERPETTRSHRGRQATGTHRTLRTVADRPA